VTRKVQTKRDQVGWLWLRIFGWFVVMVLDMDNQGAPSLIPLLAARRMAGDKTAKSFRDCPL